MSVLPSVGTSVPSPNISDIIQSVSNPPKTSGFRKILGAVAGGVGNLVMPGVGTAIGSLIGGQQGTGSLLGSDTWQYIQYQQQMQQEMRQFEMTSTILKNRHDSSMSAIRNMKSS
ncbi:MAG: hypothetical protein NTW28_09485 [Candidatus Solibacter sp.]|nr:hypothetical protein [Candidatus Solibacter sp.]